MLTRSPLVTFSKWATRASWLLVFLATTSIANFKEARGACGDYLSLGSSHTPGRSHTLGTSHALGTSFIVTGLHPVKFSGSAVFQLSSSQLDLNTLTASSRPSPPCRGPNCGRQPLHEAIPHAVPLVRDVEKLAYVEALSIGSQLRVDFLTGFDPRPLLPTLAHEIFHPPRV